MTLSSKQDPLSPKSPLKAPVHPWQLQTLRFAAKCSGTSPTPWTTQTSATKSKVRAKKLDWLRKNRALCEESRDFFDNFMSKSCGSAWCDHAAPQLDDWFAESNSSGAGGCQGVEEQVELVEKKRTCKAVG